MQPPTLQEDFVAVYHVPSFKAVEALVNLWGRKSRGASTSSTVRAHQTHRLSNFYKFPRTPHLFATSDTSHTRDDLVIAESDALHIIRHALNNPTTHVLTLEEKIDGANLGISLDPATNTLTRMLNSAY